MKTKATFECLLNRSVLTDFQAKSVTFTEIFKKNTQKHNAFKNVVILGE